MTPRAAPPDDGGDGPRDPEREWGAGKLVLVLVPIALLALLTVLDWWLRSPP